MMTNKSFLLILYKYSTPIYFFLNYKIMLKSDIHIKIFFIKQALNDYTDALGGDQDNPSQNNDRNYITTRDFPEGSWNNQCRFDR